MDEHWYLQAQPALFPQSGGQDLLGQLHPGLRLPLEGMGAAPETGKRGPRAGTEQSSSGSRRVWASCLVGRGYSVSWQVCDLGQVKQHLTASLSHLWSEVSWLGGPIGLRDLV